jgi:hypothetical protein
MRPDRWLAAMCLILAPLLLGGCVTTDDTESETAPVISNPSYGMRVEATGPFPARVTPGTTHTWPATATNGETSSHFTYTDDGCTTPWIITLTGPEGSVDPATPAATCRNAEEHRLEPGDSVGTRWTWDGRIASANGGKDAPPGEYRLRIQFRAHHEGIHESDAHLLTTFQVTG